MQDWLKDDLTEQRGRRTIHFHWIENGSAYPIAGQPLPSRPAMDANYQRALLETDYKALGAIERRFADAHQERRGAHHLAGGHRPALPRRRSARQPAGRRRVGGARGAGQGAVDKEIELPAGVVRVAPLEDTVEGVIAFPPSQWDGRPVEGLKLRFSKGRVVEVTATSGKDAVEAEMSRAGEAGRAFREIGARLQPAARRPRARAVDSVLRLRRRRRPAVARRQHRAWRRGRRRATSAGISSPT